MRRVVALALSLLAVASLSAQAVASESDASSTGAVIANAAIAPLRDALSRNASALCADFVPSVAATLVSTAAPGASCQAAAEQVFAATAPNEPPSLGAPVLEHAPKVDHLELAGAHATITTTIGLSGRLTVELEELGGSWLVSSPARLATIAGCRLAGSHACPPGAKVFVFVYAPPRGQDLSLSAPPPAAVKRAGARVTHEFESGRTDVAQSGCLACHRIGQDGNRGPGQNLTHVGNTLSRAQIEHVILHPSAPMPSFKNLPPRKLHDIVRFLSLLR
jgi:hypothetical protein